MSYKALILAGASILLSSLVLVSCGRQEEKPRVLVSSDIGGTDPDDNQSMAHLLMYSDMFDLEGIVSSPSYGPGSKQEILRMIDLYEKDYPVLRDNDRNLMTPDELRAITKEGRRGLMPLEGYAGSTEGSDWIVQCARRESDRPLWVLVWGTLGDVAQALHDAPDIADRIRVYYIGGPNKKWGVNSYDYIAKNFPDLWIIENNSSYRGFLNGKTDYDYEDGYYDRVISGAGALGEDFIDYYKGIPRMGDTPSVLYMMNGDPEDPQGESWGGSFVPTDRTSRRLLEHPLSSARDTVPVYSVMEIRFKGPEADIHPDSTCFIATIDKQQWRGFYEGNGSYVLRYSPKQEAVLTYVLSSDIPELDGQNGSFVVDNTWPGAPDDADFMVGEHWYTDRSEPELFEGRQQGAMTIRKWRRDALDDWAARWAWLRK